MAAKSPKVTSASIIRPIDLSPDHLPDSAKREEVD